MKRIVAWSVIVALFIGAVVGMSILISTDGQVTFLESLAIVAGTVFAGVAFAWALGWALFEVTR